jgi:hypothetical protein
MDFFATSTLLRDESTMKLNCAGDNRPASIDLAI